MRLSRRRRARRPRRGPSHRTPIHRTHPRRWLCDADRVAPQTSPYHARALRPGTRRGEWLAPRDNTDVPNRRTSNTKPQNVEVGRPGPADFSHEHVDLAPSSATDGHPGRREGGASDAVREGRRLSGHSRGACAERVEVLTLPASAGALLEGRGPSRPERPTCTCPARRPRRGPPHRPPVHSTHPRRWLCDADRVAPQTDPYHARALRPGTRRGDGHAPGLALGVPNRRISNNQPQNVEVGRPSALSPQPSSCSGAA
jgi:hypothetical protein